MAHHTDTVVTHLNLPTEAAMEEDLAVHLHVGQVVWEWAVVWH